MRETRRTFRQVAAILSSNGPPDRILAESRFDTFVEGFSALFLRGPAGPPELPARPVLPVNEFRAKT